MNRHEPGENESYEVGIFSDVAGCLSLPFAGLALLGLAGGGSSNLLFGMLWVAFGCAMVGAHYSTAIGRSWGQFTIVLITVSLLLVLLVFSTLMPMVQGARE
jgi:hypothetical protein